MCVWFIVRAEWEALRVKVETATAREAAIDRAAQAARAEQAEAKAVREAANAARLAAQARELAAESAAQAASAKVDMSYSFL